MTRAAVASIFLALNFYIYHFLATDEVHPPRESFATFPLQLGEWKCPGKEKMLPQVEAKLGVTDYLICTYYREKPPAWVGVYAGYNASQVRRKGGGNPQASIHPPKHCLPGSGWDIISAQHIVVDFPGLPERPAQVNRLVIAKGEARELVYYWYQSRGRVIADDWRKILALFWDRATRHRSDGSLVRFTIPIFQNDLQSADAAFRDLAPRLLPVLRHYLPD